MVAKPPRSEPSSEIKFQPPYKEEVKVEVPIEQNENVNMNSSSKEKEGEEDSSFVIE